MANKNLRWLDGRKVTNETAEMLAGWCSGTVAREINPTDGTPILGVNVPTVIGVERASQGDYVVLNAYQNFEAVPGAEYEAQEDPDVHDVTDNSWDGIVRRHLQ